MPTAAANVDIDGARKAGYSDDEIVQQLQKVGKVDWAGAQKAGYSAQDVLSHLGQQPQQPSVDATQQARKSVSMPAGATPSELGGPTDFSGRIGQRIESNLNSIPHVINMALGEEPPYPGEVQAARELAGQTNQPMLGSKALGNTVRAMVIGPRMAYGLAKQYWHDPATLAGDVVTAMPELAEMELPANKQFGGPPVPPGDITAAADAINARQAASGVQMTAPPTPHDEALFKASRDFHNAATDYDEKVSQNFDLSKRDQIEAQQQHQADLLKAKQDYDAAVTKHNAAAADHQAKVQAAQESQEQAASVAARKQQITETLPSLAEEVRNRTQQIYQEGRGQLNQQWDAIRDGVGSETPTPISGVVDALNKAESTYLRGSPQSLTRFRQLISELGIGDMTGEKLDEAGGAEATQLPAGHYYQLGDVDSAPWQTVRTHSANIGRAMAGGDLGNVYPAMKLVRNALEDAAGGVAESKGYGEAYQATRAREAQFRKDFEDLGPVSIGRGNPAARLVRAPNATFASDIIHGKASDLLEQALGRWDKTGDIATTIQQMRDLKAELGSLPKVKVLPTPPPFTTQAPTLQTPQAPSTIPERAMPEPPQYPQVGPPKPPASAPLTTRQRIIQEAARVAGKVTGGALGSAIHHPLIGYGIGGEAGSQIGKALTREGPAKVPPLPPLPKTSAEYTRTILAAKEGQITPAEASARIRRGGGSTRVSPLPPPP